MCLCVKTGRGGVCGHLPLPNVCSSTMVAAAMAAVAAVAPPTPFPRPHLLLHSSSSSAAPPKSRAAPTTLPTTMPATAPEDRLLEGEGERVGGGGGPMGGGGWSGCSVTRLPLTPQPDMESSTMSCGLACPT